MRIELAFAMLARAEVVRNFADAHARIGRENDVEEDFEANA